jgi:hypothetical protein
MGVCYVFMAFVVIACITVFILESRKESKNTKEYNAYIESIKVGDEFDWQEEPDTIRTDPFAEKRDNIERVVVISDIKENGAGYKWVKYYYKIYAKPGHEPAYFTDEIHSFVRYRNRINTKNLEN